MNTFYTTHNAISNFGISKKYFYLAKPCVVILRETFFHSNDRDLTWCVFQIDFVLYLVETILFSDSDILVTCEFSTLFYIEVPVYATPVFGWNVYSRDGTYSRIGCIHFIRLYSNNYNYTCTTTSNTNCLIYTHKSHFLCHWSDYCNSRRI